MPNNFADLFDPPDPSFRAAVVQQADAVLLAAARLPRGAFAAR